MPAMTYAFERTQDGHTILQTIDQTGWVEIAPREIAVAPSGIEIFGVICREFFAENGVPIYGRDDQPLAVLMGGRSKDGREMLRAFPAQSMDEAEAILKQQLRK